MKSFLGFLAVMIFAAVNAGEVKQVWPAKGMVKLTCGDYRIAARLANNGRIGMFAYNGQELFAAPGATQLGTLYEAPFPKEKDTVLKLTVDGVVPETVAMEYSGKEIILEREGLYGDIRIFSRYTLTPAGLTWAVRYRIESTGHKAKYFYLFTMPWSKAFTEYAYSNNGVVKYGVLNNDNSWEICSNLQKLAMFAPSCNVVAVSETVTPIPVESRRHTIWDLKHFHKHFVFHKRPEWKAGYESPEYVMRFYAFNADQENWKAEVEKTFNSGEK